MLRLLTLHIIFILFIGNSLFAQNKKRVKENLKAENLELIADSLLLEEKFGNAVDKYIKAARIFERNKKWYNAVKNYRQTAWCYLNINKLDSAQYFNNYSKKLLFKKANNFGEPELFEKSEIYYNQAKIYLERSKFDSTIYYVKKSLNIINKLNAHSNSYNLILAKYYQTFGYTNYVKGNYEASLKFYFNALNLRQKELKQEHELILISYFNIAIVYYAKRDYKKASENFWYVIDNCSDDDKIWKANSYNYLGAIQYITMEFKKAITYYNSALKIYKEINGGNSLQVALCKNNIGQAYLQLKDYENALKHLKISVQIIKENLGETHSALSQYLLPLGQYYYQLGETNQAIKIFTEALDILDMNEFPDKLIKNKLYNFKGLTYLKTANNDKAVQYFQRAICEIISEFDYNENLNDPEIFFEGTNIINSNIDIISKPTLYDNLCNKAFANYQIYIQDNSRINNLLQSFNSYKLVFHLLDIIRLDLSNEESKYTLSNFEKTILINAIHVCFELNNIFPEKLYSSYAIKFADKLKSASLSDNSYISNAIKNSNIPAELVNKETELSNELSFLKTQISKNKQETEKISITEYENTYNNLAIEYDTLSNYLKATYPKYYHLIHSNELNINEVKSEIKENEIIIEYLVTDTNIFIVTLNKKNYEIINVHIDSSFKKSVLKYYKSIRKVEISNFITTNSILFEKLIAPIQNRIKNKKSLVIIPDDYLFYIPFEALYNPENSANKIDFRNLSYLIKDYDIRYNYSINLWMFNKNHIDKEKNISDDFIGFAPVFENEESLALAELNTNDTTTRSVVIDGKRFSKLLYSEKEINEISNLFIKNNRNASTFFYNKASEDNFKNNIAAYKYIHISSHGFADKNNPNLSGLAFYHSEDSTICDSINIEDGLLYSSELSSIDINADLVVLSACETGIGKLVIGEGLIAINRSFMNSGVPNTIYSLWNVLDKNTSDFMIEFYKGVLSGKSYSQALRDAKLKMIKNISSSFPKIWSSFVLLGI